MENIRRISKQIFAFFLIMALGIAGLGAAEVEAATNKALRVSYSFNGQNYEKDGDSCGYNNNYGIYVHGTSKKTAIKNLKMSVDIYIPKTALKKNGAIIDVSPYLDCMDSKENYVGYLGGKISLSAVNEDGKVKLYAWDEIQQKNVKSSTYGSCKAGTGAYKSYYVIKIKKVPFTTQMIRENGESVQLGAKDKYTFNMGVSITGENNKGSGKLYIDNMKITSGSKTVVSQDFSKKPKYYGASNKEKELSKSKIKIEKF